MRKLQLFIKRMFDIFVSATFIVVFTVIPLWFLIAIAIKATSKGPVIFKQERVGKDGKVFKIYKFRTMLIPEESFDDNGEPLENYKRITKVGAFLRKTSLDELAQLFNVLNGTMSICGPRPTLAYQVEKYNDEQKKRLNMRPGITGWAQVHGRNDLSWSEKIEYDIEYVEKFSIWMDIKILFRTVGIVFGGKGINFTKNDAISSNNKVQKKVLVLCGGIPQVELIKQLKGRGYFVVLADRNSGCEGAKHADIFFPISALDVDGVQKLAQEQSVEFIITVCADQVLEVMAIVSENLGLPCYIGAKTATDMSKKSYMKNIFIANDIPTSNFVTVKEYSEQYMAGLQFPLIVKPVDAYSSRGVKKVDSAELLKEAVENAINISRTGEAIVEEYVEGQEISVDVYVANGKPYILCQTILEKVRAEGKFIIYRTVYPATLNKTVKEKVEKVAAKIVEAFGITNAPMLIQLITNGEEISVIEFCARTGGGEKFRLIKRVSGFDVVKAAIDLSEGKEPVAKVVHHKNLHIVNEFIYCNPGILDHLEGFEEAKKRKYITEYFQLKQCGTEVGNMCSSGDRVAYCTLEAKTVKELGRKHKKAAKILKVIDDCNNDILKHELLDTFKVE